MPEPSVFGNYVILRSIAAGGMGEIFLAKRTGPEGFEKVLVLKKMLPHLMRDQRSVTMFLNEAKLAAQLDHTNVVQIYDFGIEGDTYYIAMEYIHGKNLRDLLDRTRRRESRIPIAHSLHIAGCVLAGLDFAHKKLSYDGKPLTIIHRDISPQNVLISYDGGVKLTDFGIAKTTILESETTLGTIKGKLSYMSPEQVNGEPLDHRTDIFSLGIVLFEMLTGRKLFPDETGFTSVIDRIRKVEIPLPRDLNPAIPEELEDILLTALARLPHDRFQEAREMASALSQFVRQQGLTSGPYELAAYLRNQFPEEDLAKILASEETAFAPTPVRPSAARDPSRATMTMGPTAFGRRPFVSRPVIVATAMGMLLSFGVMAALPRLLPGIRPPPDPTPSVTQAHALAPAETGPPSAASIPEPAPLPPAPEPTPAASRLVLLHIVSSPMGANVTVDGQVHPQKTGTALQLTPGETHLLSIEKPGYLPRTREVTFEEGEKPKPIHVELTPRPATVTIQTVPEGAAVSFAGQSLVAPGTLRDIVAGSYQVEARLEGYEAYRETRLVVPGEHNSFTLPLRKVAGKGNLRVDTTPWTTVYVDGERMGETPMVDRPVAAGNHSVRLHNPDLGIEDTETVDLKPGETETIKRRYEGTLRFEVPGVTEYRIDDRAQKDRVVKLLVGNYKVTFTDASGSLRTVPVTISVGGTTPVR